MLGLVFRPHSLFLPTLSKPILPCITKSQDFTDKATSAPRRVELGGFLRAPRVVGCRVLVLGWAASAFLRNIAPRRLPALTAPHHRSLFLSPGRQPATTQHYGSCKRPSNDHHFFPVSISVSCSVLQPCSFFETRTVCTLYSRTEFFPLQNAVWHANSICVDAGLSAPNPRYSSPPKFLNIMCNQVQKNRVVTQTQTQARVQPLPVAHQAPVPVAFNGKGILGRSRTGQEDFQALGSLPGVGARCSTQPPHSF